MNRKNYLYIFIAFSYLILPSRFLSAAVSDSVKTDSSVVPYGEVRIDELDFKNTDLRDVVRVLATKYRINVLIDNSVDKRVTIHLVNVSVADALKFIVRDNDLELKRYGEIYKIVNPPQPEPPPPPEKKWVIQYKDGLITLDFKNEDVKDALYQISKLTGKTIIVDRHVNGAISGFIQELPLKEALYQLLKNNGYLIKKDGDVFQVRRMGWEETADKGLTRNFWINTHEKLIDIEVKSAPVAQIINEISRQMNINVFLYGELKGTVTANAVNLTLEQCLNLILNSNDYTFKKDGDIYLIGDKSSRVLVSSKLIKLNHLKVDGIMEMLPKRVMEKAEYKIVKEHNALLVTGSQDVILDVQEIVKNIDHPIPQILIEALVVDYNYQDIREISVDAGLTGGSALDSSRGSNDKWFPGIDILWGAGTANKYLKKVGDYFGATNIGTLPADFYLQVKALETVGKANIRSKPQIATLNGHEADLTIGQTQYYKLITTTPIRDPSQIYIQESEQFHTIEANITLKITPWVSGSGEITVEIHPEFNNPVGQLSPNVPPTIQRRALNSTVRIQDGETIILGGLIQTVDSENITKLPILGSIPVIGRIFQNKNHDKRKSELLIYITPHLSYGTELNLDR